MTGCALLAAPAGCAGDGNFYLAYITQQASGGGAEYDIKLLQVSSSGASATMTVTSWLTPNFVTYVCGR